MKQKRAKLLIHGLVVGLIVISAGLIASFLYIARDTSPIPQAISSQLTFSPFVIPDDSKIYITSDYKINVAENGTQLLSYVVKVGTVDITISQYPQPSEFNDIPEYKSQFLSNVIRQYESLQTSNGALYLGRQSLQNNKQIGVILERGLLVLMSPTEDISQDEWRKLGDQLEIQKID